MNQKYEFTGETKDVFGRTLHRIRAIKDFGDVKAGDVGGWIESEKNLSEYGNCWVYGDAWVHGNSRVSENARIFGNSRIFGDARVSKNAWVHGNSRVSENARIFGNSRIFGDARVYGDARISQNSDYISILPIGSEDGTFTAYKSKKGIECSRGCFSGTLDDFEAAVKKTHGDNQFAQEYALVISLVRKRLGGETNEF